MARKTNILTYDFCQKEALKYRTRKEFQVGSSSSYVKSRKKGWLDKVCCHMKPAEIKYKWTYDKCKSEALKYESRSEFRIKSGSAYSRCSKNGWLDCLCKNMKVKGNRFKRFLYAFEFDDNSVYVGLTFNLKTRLNDHINGNKTSVSKYIQKNKFDYEFKQLTTFPIDVSYAVKMEERFVELYKVGGWKILNKAKTGSLGSGIRIWTYDKCKKESEKYNSRGGFKHNSASSYRATLRYGWLNEFFPTIS